MFYFIYYFCLKVLWKDEIAELQVYIFTWLCIYFCIVFFLSVEFELGGVAVVLCLPKKKKEKEKVLKNNKKTPQQTGNVACLSLQRFQGRLN